MRLRSGVSGLIAGAALLVPGAAMADTLREALALAYHTNPTLQSARADQRANDENVPLARSEQLPSIGGSAQYLEFLHNSDTSRASPSRQLSAGADLSVPLYAGGAIRNSIRAAEVRVRAGQADLRGVESELFTQVTAAYMDVLRDEAIVGLNRNNVRVLQVNLQATSDRFEIGDLTRTDVAQSGARLALAQGDLQSAESNLIGSRERYVQLVGKPPLDLEPPPPLPRLPGSADEAVAAALENNPDLLAAQERSRASRYDVRTAGAERLPRVEVFTGGGYSSYLGSLGGNANAVFSQSGTDAQVGVRATIPIFQGGAPAARERQAQARRASTLETEIAVERNVIAQVRAAYSSWRASRGVIAATQTAVDAATLSLEGVRAENSVGNRTILNILDAEQELLRAQVQLVSARRNEYVSGFSLLAAMGRAEAQDLGIEGGPLYHAEDNYRRVRHKWWDWDRDPEPRPRSTRTVDTLSQDASISE